MYLPFLATHDTITTMGHHHHRQHPASPSANLNITSDYPGTPYSSHPLFHLRRAVLERGDMVSFFGFQSVHFLALARAVLATGSGWRRWPILLRPDFFVRILVLGLMTFLVQLGVNVQLAQRFKVEDVEVREKGRRELVNVRRGLWMTAREWMRSDVGFVMLVGFLVPWLAVSVVFLMGGVDVQVLVNPRVWLLWISAVMLLVGLRMALNGGEGERDVKSQVGLENGGDSPDDTSDEAGKASKGAVRKKGKGRKPAKKKKNTLTF